MFKVAALVLSCSKPEYQSRREQQRSTYIRLQAIGVDVLVLLHDPAIKESEIRFNDMFSKSLFVPILEDYEYIPQRLWAAYEFLANQGYTHILKLDDDIQILDTVDMNFLVAAIHAMKEFDYVALKGVGGGEVPDKPGSIIINTYHWNKCKNPMMNHTYAVYPAVDYAGGPCYWISARAIKRFSKSDFEKCVFEDVCLGIACKKHGVPLVSGVDTFRNIIRGDDSPWPYTQYVTKNFTLYEDLLNR